jgi:hypothetical protein
MPPEEGRLRPPPGYRKKLVNRGGGCPLTDTFTREQVEARVAFFRELNAGRDGLPARGSTVRRLFNLYGWEDTTTVRVYMRETVSRIAAQLFRSDYRVSVRNVNRGDGEGNLDKDHGHVQVYVEAFEEEIKALLEYIKPGSSYYVYDGEKHKYVPGDTEASAFIITRPEDSRQPRCFWRRSQSFVSALEAVPLDGGGAGG